MILHFSINCQQLCWTNPCRGAVEGTIGAVLAQFEVDSEWNGLSVMVVFEHDALMEQPAPVVWTGEPVIVPAVALSTAGRLRVGLVGLGDNGSIRLTTRRMAQGIPVHPSTGTGGETVDPDPTLWEQILAIIGDLDDLTTLAKNTLVAAINEAAKSGGGGVAFDIGNTLVLQNGTLDVNTAKTVQSGNLLPVTSNAVSVSVEALQEALMTLTNRVNAALDSTDIDLDQLSELVAYIRDNRELIDQITTGKVSVADIVDSLTSTSATRPLSANQGRVLKALIDGITIPTKLPNPYALTFTGAVSGTYDGTKALTITIPTGGTSEGTPGADGREVTLRVSGGYIQWQYVGETSWTNLIALSELTGDPGTDGREVELRSSGTYIQWRYAGDTSWTDLVALSALKGDSGEDGGYYTPSVDDSGNLSWEASRADMPSVETVNIKGQDGSDGQRGTGILNVTTAPTSYSTTVNGTSASYRILLSTVISQAKTDAVFAGDSIRYSYYLYPVVAISGSYVYCGTRVSIRGATGAAGSNGADGYTPVRGTDYWTEADQQSMVDDVLAALPTWEGGSY